MPEGVHQSAETRLCLPELVGPRPASAPLQDECARAMAQFEHSIVLEFRVCFSYSVMAYYDFLSKRSNSRQLIAGTEYAGFYGVPDLLHELQVEGLPEMRIEFECH
ncbi:MAG TPA: hypothetical protein VFU86_09935 [Terriglobales bacterium]|nr:hypothetical protein [Terriglobales bacterium]